MPPRRWIGYRNFCAKFTRQKPLGKYVADFYCSRHRLVIEIDGDSHYVDGARAYDEQRTAVLGLEGIQVIRFTNADVMQNFESVCGIVSAALEQDPKS